MTEFSIPVILSERTSGSRRKAHGDARVQTSAQNRVLKRPTGVLRIAGGGRGRAGKHGRRRRGRTAARRSARGVAGPCGRPLPCRPRRGPSRTRCPACRRAPGQERPPQAGPRTAHGACGQPGAPARRRLRAGRALGGGAARAVLHHLPHGARHHPELERPGRARPALPLGPRVCHGGRGRPARRNGLPLQDARPPGRLRRAVRSAPAAHGQARPHPVRLFQPGAPRGDQEGAQRTTWRRSRGSSPTTSPTRCAPSPCRC